MPSAFTHAFAAVAIGTAVLPEPRRQLGLIAAGAALAVLPDADVVAFVLGIPYEHMLGHRGLSHSLLFAAAVAGLATWLVLRSRLSHPPAGRTFTFLLLAATSHGVLDAFTNGGLGVAFLAPLSDARTFFPWRPIVVAPISIRRFFSGRGVDVLASELLYVWLPAAALAVVALLARARAAPPAPQPRP